MAVAQASPVADTILAQAIDGPVNYVNFPAHPFSLTDQHRQTVTLASLRGKVVLLTFLDPVCNVDCPLIAQEFRQADQLLGADARRVELVAIVANPVYRALAYTRGFDQQEGLASLPNWLYLTGTTAQLGQAAHAWGYYVQILSGGSMVGHGDNAFVIDGTGRVRQLLDTDPGPGTQSTKSSFAAELTDAVRQVLGSSS